MLLKILLGFLCGVHSVVTENNTAEQAPLPLLLVSFDGFRADYLQRFPMPNLKLLYSQGVLVEQLTNVFITKTFPNHYSLVDDNIGLLVSELKRTGLWGHINVLVTSDHGMAQCSAERLIQLDTCLHPDNYTLVDLSPVTALIPKKDPDTVFALLKKCHPHMTAYLKKAIPDRLHYRNNQRIQPIILIADEGWTIVRQGNKLPRLGDHGYDNSLPSMHPFLAAVGPSFRQGYRMSSLQSVDIYPLMCHLLSVPQQPNNGTLTKARCLLAAETCWDVPLVVGLVVGVLLVLTTITVLFRYLSQRRPSGPRPFQRLQVDYDDDDDDPLLE
eukprot:superscaffoldBa00001632_g11377